MKRIEIDLSGPIGPVRLCARMFELKNYCVIGFSPDQPALELGWNVDNLWGVKLGPLFTVTATATIKDWREQAKLAVEESLASAGVLDAEWPDGSRFYKVIPEAIADARDWGYQRV